MPEFSKKEAEIRKKAVFDQLSPRRKKYIERIGYEEWNPFQEPKDPIDIRRDRSKRTSQELIRSFLRSRRFDEYSTSYGRGVHEICMGLINEDDRCIAMYEFSCWYRDLLIKEGLE